MKTYVPATLRGIKAFLIVMAGLLAGIQSYGQANDLCSGAISLTSSAVCTGTAGAITGATSWTTITPTPTCGTTTRNDVWYSFVAQTTSPTITLTVVTGMTNARLTLFSGTCASMTALFCGNTSLSPTGLTVGSTYYIRVYTTPNTTGTFTICVTDPRPANDLCTGTISLTSGASCINTSSTLLNATASATLTGCGNASSADVWFSYTATSHYPTITLSSIGTSLTTAVPYIQLYSAGSCTAGVFSGTSIACASGTTLQTDTLVAGAGLTIGNVYYIRVYSGSVGPFTSGTWTFNICITNDVVTVPTVQYGKSYLNITKGVNGGTIEPGDTLEMRATLVLTANNIYNVSVRGNIPANTVYVPNTIRILTNEGQLYKQWTDAADGDAGTISGTKVTINIGKGATGTNGGTLKYNYRPSVFGSQCLVVAVYHVVVNTSAAYGTVLSVGGDTLSYSTDAVPTEAVTNVTFPTVSAILYKNTGICSNTVGSNGLQSEYNGTFGSGNLKNRTASSKVPSNYTYSVLNTGAPGDDYYGISNNTSPGGTNYSINPNDPLPANHIFTVWDIIGDHTGAASSTAGNPPTDTTGGKTGGYMVVVNAAYRTDTAFLDTVKNLCPNTYYEYSAWFRNLCKKCSGDSTGTGPATAGYVPTGPGDSSGVHPNLTYNISGYDYYTTGDILYTGQWIKKGFTYLTGASQTQMIISIRNNAPGGGGNDWVMDDIGVATCTPNLTLNPSSPNTNVCYGDGVSLSADVKSYFNNYAQYTWEISTDNGVTWASTGYGGTGTPVFGGTEYDYTAGGPSFIGDSATNNNIYRVRVASTSSNLTDTSCSFSSITTVKVYVNNCSYLLKASLTNVNGYLQNNNGVIRWQTVNESDGTSFEIEKSFDGSQFSLIGTVKGNAINGAGSYAFTDPVALTGSGYYRIKMIEKTGFTYSRVVLLSPDKIQFTINNLVNPFTSTISFDLILPEDGMAKIYLLDNFGRVVKEYNQSAYKGVTPVKIGSLGGLSGGIYAIKIDWQNESCIRRIIKTGS